MENCLKCLGPLQESDETQYGLHKACFMTWFALTEASEFTGIERRSSDSKEPTPESGLMADNWARSFFHGKFKKYSAHLKEEAFIFKMREEQFPELPNVEFLCNQIAQALGIPVPEFYLISFYGERTFVTKSFIKKKRIKRIVKSYLALLERSARLRL